MAKLGVRSLLFLALGASAVLPVGLFGISQAQRWEDAELEAIDRQALAAARSAADQVSLSVLGFAHASESAAAQVAAVPGFTPAGLHVALAAHVQHHPEFLGAYAADASGSSVAAVSHRGEPVEAGLNYADREYFSEMQATRRTAISRVQLGRVTHVVSVTISSPFFDREGAFAGFTCTSLNLGGIAERAKKSVLGMADGRVVLIDGEGRVIADSSGKSGAEPRDVSRVALLAPVERAEESELRSGVDEAGRPVRAMVVGLSEPVAGWHVVAMTPKSTVDAHARELRNQTAVFVLVLVFVALGLAAWVAAWLARPVRALARTADALTAGELETPLPVVAPNAPREMERLTIAISSMIRKLREHSLQLEDLVAVRTGELVKTNAELQGALEIIRENERRIRDDIAKARLFQERMLSVLPERPGLDIAAHYAPLEEVSGDIYDVCELEDGRLRVLVIDATGHGVQASMRTIFLKSTYDRLKWQSRDASTALAELNEQLVSEFPDGELHSEACCLDLRENSAGYEVSFANAGNSPLFVLSAGAPPREQYTGGPLLGVESVDWPPPERFQLSPGELLLVSTDGLFEQWNENRQRFDAELADLRSVTEGAQATLARVIEKFDAFRGEQPLADDLTVIALAVSASLDGDEPVREPT